MSRRRTIQKVLGFCGAILIILEGMVLIRGYLGVLPKLVEPQDVRGQLPEDKYRDYLNVSHRVETLNTQIENDRERIHLVREDRKLRNVQVRDIRERMAIGRAAIIETQRLENEISSASREIARLEKRKWELLGKPIFHPGNPYLPPLPLAIGGTLCLTIAFLLAGGFQFFE